MHEQPKLVRTLYFSAWEIGWKTRMLVCPLNNFSKRRYIPADTSLQLRQSHNQRTQPPQHIRDLPCSAVRPVQPPPQTRHLRAQLVAPAFKDPNGAAHLLV